MPYQRMEVGVEIADVLEARIDPTGFMRVNMTISSRNPVRLVLEEISKGSSMLFAVV